MDTKIRKIPKIGNILLSFAIFALTRQDRMRLNKIRSSGAWRLLCSTFTIFADKARRWWKNRKWKSRPSITFWPTVGRQEWKKSKRMDIQFNHEGWSTSPKKFMTATESREPASKSMTALFVFGYSLHVLRTGSTMWRYGRAGGVWKTAGISAIVVLCQKQF